MSNMKAIKRQLRKELIRQRSAICQSVREYANRAICQVVLNLAAYQNAKTVMVYIDYRGEVSTRSLIEEAWLANKIVGVPLTIPATKEMRIFKITRWEDLRLGNYGIQEPRSESCQEILVEDIDLVISPGVAFDNHRNRMGYGGGYYDRFSKKVRDDCKRIALAFDMQIIEHVPTGRYDVPMDLIVTENQVIE